MTGDPGLALLCTDGEFSLSGLALRFVGEGAESRMQLPAAYYGMRGHTLLHA
jgi:hypothetical protein